MRTENRALLPRGTGESDQYYRPVIGDRGNGWIIASLRPRVRYSAALHASYKPLKRMSEEFARALVANQDDDGLWHTVMTNPKSYAECSVLR